METKDLLFKLSSLDGIANITDAQTEVIDILSKY